MYLKTRDNINIYFEEKGQGKPIIFIHGWSGSCEFFKPQLEELSKNNRVIIYDLRGHGKSDRTDKGLTLQSFAKDLKELITNLDLEKPILIGWSMGAMVIFEYIKQFGTKDIEKIGILDMTPKLVNDMNWTLGLDHGIFIEEDQEDAVTLICESWMDFAKSFIKKALPYLDEESLEAIYEDSETNTPFVMAALWHSMGVNDYRCTINEIDIPTLIIYGGKSTLYSYKTADYMERKIENSIKICFEDATHFLVIEEQDRLNREIEEFIKN